MTVRFDEGVWELLEREAAREGVSPTHFVRDAALRSIGAHAERRSHEAARASVADLAQAGARRAHRDAADERAHRDAADERAHRNAADERARLDALRATGLLDSPPEEAFDRLTDLVRRVLAVPVALVSLVDEDRQFFKSQTGLPEPWASGRQTPLSHSFCQYAVASREPLVVSDAREHPVLRESRAIPDLGVIAYAGVPLIDDGGRALGSLCAIDSRPRVWTSEQIALLADLARLAVDEIKLARRGWAEPH